MLSSCSSLFNNEKLTALLDRLTHRAYVVEMNGESFRFRETVKKSELETDATKFAQGSPFGKHAIPFWLSVCTWKPCRRSLEPPWLWAGRYSIGRPLCVEDRGGVRPARLGVHGGIDGTKAGLSKTTSRRQELLGANPGLSMNSRLEEDQPSQATSGDFSRRDSLGDLRGW